MLKQTTLIILLVLPLAAFAQKGISDQDVPTKDVVHSDDVIIQGSTNIGLDAIINRGFGSDLMILSENNVRILFEDTSNSAGFPKKDWRITVNDQNQGEEEHFSIDDATSNQEHVFKIEGGAGSNTLVVGSNSAIGVRTDNPNANSIHLKYGNSPKLRLEQDNSSGFTAQTWDVAGNETTFFVRDVTHSSSIPFRIETGVADEFFVISNDERVGINDISPDAFFHGRKPAEGATAEVIAKFNISDDADGALFIENGSATDSEFSPVIKGINDLGNTGLSLLSNIDDNLGTDEAAHVINASVIGGGALASHPVLQVQNDGSALVTLAASGMLGVGTSDPMEKIHTDGKIRMESGASNGALISGDADGVMSWTAPGSINLSAFNNDLTDNNDFVSNVALDANANLVFTGTGGAFNTSVALSSLIDDADADPTNEIETWSTLAGIPAGFVDGTDDVDDADADPTNEFNTSMALVGTQLQIADGGGTLMQDLSSLQDGNGHWGRSGSGISYSSGNVGIGTASPTEALHVEGNIAKTGMLLGVSDRRIKTDIVSIEGAMAMINSLDGKQFVFDGSQYQGVHLPKGTQFGLIAQEVEQELAHLVKSGVINAHTEDGSSVSLKAVAYEQLIPVLINALKEQHKELEEMKSLQKNMDQRLSSLEALIPVARPDGSQSGLDEE